MSCFISQKQQFFVERMTQNRDFAFGLPSVPRSTMPSMYEMLSWVDSSNYKQQPLPTQENAHPKEEEKAEEPPVRIKENIIDNVSQVKTQYGACKGKKISKSCTKHHELYEYKESKLKESQSIVQRSKSKVEVARAEKTHVTPKKLDPSNQADRVEIQARKKRIKEFELVTRDLPNTAFTTYYGKPAFEAYGRGGSNSKLLSHNVMPHKGDNHPKSVQSYYSALIKGKKTISVSHIPRKPIAQIHTETQQTKQESIHIPLEKPDLINNVRFTAQNPQEKADKRIPSNKVTAIKQKLAKKSDRKEKKQKRPKSKEAAEADGLKYMNNREDLLKIMQNKRLTASRLAYKVTECYPCEWQDQQKLKQSTKLWQNAKIAGLASKPSEPVGKLLKNTGKPDE